jgi:hypothetical protein
MNTPRLRTKATTGNSELSRSPIWRPPPFYQMSPHPLVACLPVRISCRSSLWVPARVQDSHFILPSSRIFGVIIDNHFLCESFAVEDFSNLVQEIGRMIFYHDPPHMLQHALTTAQNGNFRSFGIYFQ